MQTISRKDVKIIYSQVCSGWQTKIDNILKDQQFNDEIEVEEDIIQKAFSEADEKQKKLLNKYFTLPKKITDKIKNFDDVLKIAGKSMYDILPYKTTKNKNEEKINALAKLLCIAEVLNEGWNPDWSNSIEYKYYPYFQYKNKVGWSFYSYIFIGHVSFGTAAYFKTSELAIFAGKTFLQEYKEFLQ